MLHLRRVPQSLSCLGLLQPMTGAISAVSGSTTPRKLMAVNTMAAVTVLTAGWSSGWQAEPDCEQLEQQWGMTSITGWQMSVSTLPVTTWWDGHTCVILQASRTLNKLRAPSMLFTFLCIQENVNVLIKMKIPCLSSTCTMEEEFYEVAISENWLLHMRAGISENKTDFKERFGVLAATFRKALWIHMYHRTPLCKGCTCSPYILNVLSLILLFLGKLTIPLHMNYLSHFGRTDYTTSYY